MEEKYIKDLDKIINKFILQSKKFVEYVCFPYGLIDLAVANQLTTKFIYDFEYFAFTKSTKTLVSIRTLLKVGNNEDAMILLRSVFENYLSTRYLHENSDMNNIKDFIINPINVAFSFYNINQEGQVVNRDKEIIGELKNPSVFKTGQDKKYYYNFYDVLSRYAHCNYGTIECYKEDGMYSVDKVSDRLLIRLYVIFVFTKLFELIVTVEGEDFPDKRTERTCYKLVEVSIELQKEIIDFLREEYRSNNNGKLKFHSKKMREMLKQMKKSLAEEIGSIKK
ncbi:DUF5677 domain-containing protein [Robertmurraya sp. DFI.2.37]|uniref:DUF5677 domain-containing protein n=1 Tax=Robertmurraya sp. DFI.2.37 TaxID=3031819 RepID=UPI00124821CB|nr:DUF5677 domain-containing protein [Robertmurraya sp. DFI.2.37]MDF1511452.1 DUF5677 domain-containing protein [Robertmurraya sp. DFI.2.37]